MNTRIYLYAVKAIVGAILVFVVAQGVARAQDRAAQLEEPQRFALLIGNSKYHDQGDLENLGSPCNVDDADAKSDVKVVGDALRQAGWSDVVVLCDGDVTQMTSAIREFKKKVTRTRRAMGLLYFSGHGAQVGTHNYVFGVNAKVDISAEAEAYRQNHQAQLFGTDAIDLDRELGTLQPMWSKGVVVIVDACRDNPLIGKLRKAGVDASRYPSRATDVTGLIFGFATRNGSPAPQGGMGKPSPYTEVLAEFIPRFAEAADRQEVDDLLKAVRTEVYRRSRGDQEPDSAGSLWSPPAFCLRGCPSPAEQWKDYDQVFFSSRAIEAAALVPTPLVSLPLAADRAEMRPPFAEGLLRNASLTRLMRASPARVRAPMQPAAVRERAMRVDIFWCEGDGGAAARKQEAIALFRKLRGYDGQSFGDQGYRGGEVRALPLPGAINAKIEYRLRNDVIFYDKGSAAEKSWADMIQGLSATPIQPKKQAGTSPDYLRVFLCKGYQIRDVRATLYVQIARKDQRPAAEALIGQLSQQLLGLDVETGIDPAEEQAPPRSEVRYFHRSQAQNAESVASAARAQLGVEVKAVFVRGYEHKPYVFSSIELWIGEDAKVRPPVADAALLNLGNHVAVIR
jgi:hypothetical protein